MRVLERIVQQVHDGRREELRVGRHSQPRVHLLDGELQCAVLGVQVAGNRYFAEERAHRHPFAVLDIGVHPDVGQGAVDKVTQTHEAPAQHGPSASVDSDGSPFQGMEREDRRVEDVADLVSQSSGPFDFFRRSRFGGNARVLCHCFRNGGIEASIQNVEFFGRDRKLLLHGNFRDGLADVTVIVDHLRDVEPQCPQLTPMLDR